MRAKQFILREYSRDDTAQKLGAALLQKFDREPPQWQGRILNTFGVDPKVTLDHLLARVELADPTKNKQYVPWIIRTYVNTPNLKFEDAITKTTEPLTKFFKLVQKKQIPAPNNDIGRIKDLAVLVQTVDQYPDVVDQPKDVDRGDANELYRDAQVRVIIPEDVTAACYYGQGTKWCTAGRENNMFDRYYKQGSLYIVIPTKPTHAGEKYQFHFGAKQFMDERDVQIDVGEFLDRYPQLREVFRPMAEKTDAFTFLYTVQQLDSITNTVSGLLYKQLSSMLPQRAAFMARNIAKDIFRSNSDIKDLLDAAELEEILQDDLNNSSQLVKEIAYGTDANEWAAHDQMYDRIFGIVEDFCHTTETWELLREVLEEIDEDLFMDAGMSFEHDLSQSIDDIIKDILPPMIKRAINEIQ